MKATVSSLAHSAIHSRVLEVRERLYGNCAEQGARRDKEEAGAHINGPPPAAKD
jgi:hypothetical protein